MRYQLCVQSFAHIVQERKSLAIRHLHSHLRRSERSFYNHELEQKFHQWTSDFAHFASFEDVSGFKHSSKFNQSFMSSFLYFSQIWYLLFPTVFADFFPVTQNWIQNIELLKIYQLLDEDIVTFCHKALAILLLRGMHCILFSSLDSKHLCTFWAVWCS